jgi:hypothetical protein
VPQKKNLLSFGEESDNPPSFHYMKHTGPITLLSYVARGIVVSRHGRWYSQR